MDKNEAAKFIGTAVIKAVQGGVDAADVVAILEINKANLLNQIIGSQTNSKPAKKPFRVDIQDGGN